MRDLGLCLNCGSHVFLFGSQRGSPDKYCVCREGVRIVAKYLQLREERWAVSRFQRLTKEKAQELSRQVEEIPRHFWPIRELVDTADKCVPFVLHRIADAERVALKALWYAERLERWRMSTCYERLIKEDSIDSPD